MGERIGPGGEGSWGTADVIWRNNALDLAKKVIAMVEVPLYGWVVSGATSTGAGFPEGVTGDVRNLANNILAAINSWTQSGRTTTQNVGPTPLAVTPQGGRTPTQEVIDMIDPYCRELAEQVYARVRERDSLRTQAEVAILVTDMKNAINAWLSQTPTTETVGTGSPFNTIL